MFGKYINPEAPVDWDFLSLPIHSAYQALCEGPTKYPNIRFAHWTGETCSDISLMTCQLVGTKYYRPDAFATKRSGNMILLVPDNHNQHDCNAYAAYAAFMNTTNGQSTYTWHKVGHVDKQSAKILRRRVGRDAVIETSLQNNNVLSITGRIRLLNEDS